MSIHKHESSDELGEIGAEHNPDGPWDQLEDENIKDSIVHMASKAYRPQTNDVSFPNFLDEFTLAWRELMLKVDDTSKKHGFQKCDDLSHLSPGDKTKVAILSLTIHGSFVLLGNGCLGYPGSSAVYERIPLREGHAPQNQRVPHGVVCTHEPSVETRLHFTGGRFIRNTSVVYLLYYTTDLLPQENVLRVANELSVSVAEFHTRIHSHVVTETVRDVPAKNPKREDVEELEIAAF